MLLIRCLITFLTGNERIILNKCQKLFYILNLSVLLYVSKINTKELKGFQFLVSLISGEFMETRHKEPDDDDSATQMISIGETNYNFIDFITYSDKKVCLDYEFADYQRALKQNAESGNKNRGPIKVKCLTDNKTNGTLHLIESLKDVATLLGPVGNSTKRTDAANCALILFYTRSCTSSTLAAPHFNALPRYFLDIKIGAVDSFRFHSLNTEFGIIGLPTIMLFHQGRPVVKFNETSFTINNFVRFITQHTNIEPTTTKLFVTSADFHGPLPNTIERDTDYCLWMAWIFILVCVCYYFTKSKWFAQIVEIIKRNWRESSETQNEVIN